MQTRFDLMNTCCDDCILWFTCLASWAICIAQMFIDVPQELEMLVDLLIQTVNGCMLAQQAVELKYQKEKPGGYVGMNEAIQQALGNTAIKPPVRKPGQQSMIIGAATVVGGTAGGALATSHLVKVGDPQSQQGK